MALIGPTGVIYNHHTTSQFMTSTELSYGQRKFQDAGITSYESWDLYLLGNRAHVNEFFVCYSLL